MSGIQLINLIGCYCSLASVVGKQISNCQVIYPVPSGKFTRSSFLYFDSLLHIKEKKPVKVINKDQWRSLLEFGRDIPEDLSGYDPVSYCK